MHPMPSFSLVLPSPRPDPEKTLPTDHETIARQLEATGLYRVLRRVSPRPLRRDRMPIPGAGLKRGIILDTETTGLDHATDEVVEIGMIAFTFDESGSIHDIVDRHEAFQQPSRPLSPLVRELTGITDSDLAGRSIDREALADFTKGADLILAHNARFDRPFCEKLHPSFSTLPWACTMAEIDWRSMLFETAKLGVLLTQVGLFHDAHRALADCEALLELLASPTCVRKGAFAGLLESARSTTVEITAQGAPFLAKDVLKARGYRWNPGDDGRGKAWKTTLPESAIRGELEFLQAEVYRTNFVPPMRRLDAVNRYR